MNSILRIIDNPFYFQRRYFFNILIIALLCYQGSPFKKYVVVPTNLFVEGMFVSRFNDNDYLLQVTEISKTEFDNKNGLNVVKDVCRNQKYYSVALSKKNSSITYSFVNINGICAESYYALYYDDNDNYICPEKSDNADGYSYTIKHNDIDPSRSDYLYFYPNDYYSKN